MRARVGAPVIVCMPAHRKLLRRMIRLQDRSSVMTRVDTVRPLTCRDRAHKQRRQLSKISLLQVYVSAMMTQVDSHVLSASLP